MTVPDNTLMRQHFAAIVQQYSEPLYWKIRRIVLNHDDASDILQNVFVKAWVGIDDFHNKAKLSTWLYRIAVNESLDFLRRQRSTVDIDTEGASSIAARLMADEYFDGDATQAQLQEAIAQLPDVQRAVFTMRYYDEMPYAEISAVLGTTVGALKASYHIAVKKITEYFKRHD